MALWNVRDLQPPPVNTLKYNHEEIDGHRLKVIFSHATDFYSKCDFLYTEAVLLSTAIYRLQLKFRMNKDFKQLKKINKSLELYFKMNVPSMLDNFLQLHPVSGNSNYLPTRNMLDYILVRMQGLSKLLVRIVESCSIAADLLQHKIHLGHTWKIILILFSMVSRIYIITRQMVKFTCDKYDHILSFRNKLRNPTDNNFLPDNYILPKDLRHWLNVDWIDLEVQVIEIKDDIPSIVQFFDLADSDDDVEISDEYIKINDDDDEVADVEKNIKKRLDPNVLRGFMEDDIGEIIEIPDEISIVTDESESHSDIGEVLEVVPDKKIKGPISYKKKINNDVGEKQNKHKIVKKQKYKKGLKRKHEEGLGKIVNKQLGPVKKQKLNDPSKCQVMHRTKAQKRKLRKKNIISKLSTK